MKYIIIWDMFYYWAKYRDDYNAERHFGIYRMTIARQSEHVK